MVITALCQLPTLRLPVPPKHCGMELFFFFLPVVVIAVAVTARFFRTRVGRKDKEFASAGLTFPSRRSAATSTGKHLEEVSSNNFLLLSRSPSTAAAACWSCCSILANPS